MRCTYRGGGDAQTLGGCRWRVGNERRERVHIWGKKSIEKFQGRFEEDGNNS